MTCCYVDLLFQLGLQHSLDALGRLLGVETPATAEMHNSIVKIATDVVGNYPNHPTIVPAAAHVIGAIGKSDAGVSWTTLK